MTYADQSTPAKKHNAIRMETAKRIRKLVSFCKAFLHNAPERIFDRWVGASTRGLIVKDGSVFNDGGENVFYLGSQWLPVRRALRDLDPGPADVFVDLGSGKGKVLLIAGRLPYRRVVGIELDRELSECAKRNINQAQRRFRAQNVESITASALDWPIPDDTSVLFMYNPFIGQTFRTAVDHIIESYDRKPRTLHIVYYYPWEHDWLLSTGRFVVDNVWPGNWLVRTRWWQNGYVIVSYRVVGASEGTQSGLVPHSSVRSYEAMQRWSSPNGHRFALIVKDWGERYSNS
jgi:SAM-dependent methyltransferase